MTIQEELEEFYSDPKNNNKLMTFDLGDVISQRDIVYYVSAGQTANAFLVEILKITYERRTYSKVPYLYRKD